MRSSWFPHHRVKPFAGLRLFCFPHAGAGAGWFSSWAAALPNRVEICGVELPGRETRILERPSADLQSLAVELTEAITDYLDLPYVFFGHSLGALLSYEVAIRMRSEGLPQPERLIVSASRAPQLASSELAVHDLPDRDFLRYVLGLDGCPVELIHQPELLALLLPVLRADFAASHAYLAQGYPALDCPITVMGGLADPAVDTESLMAWAELTNEPHEVVLYPGGHFYLRESDGPLGSISRRLHHIAREARQIPPRFDAEESA